MKLAHAYLILTLLMLVQLAACRPRGAESKDELIQGTWRLDGSQRDQAGREFTWFSQYEFDKGNFKQSGYPPISQAGSYRILSIDGDKLWLELFDQHGTFGTENKQIVIVVNSAQGELTIANVDHFKRTAANK
jgi:hypothetical protein